MYDILQLNDMLLPELLDIAEQQKITGAKKLDKQGLIYKILDSQAIKASETKDEPKKKGTPAAKPKKAVNVKTANVTEEAELMQGAPASVAPSNRPIKKAIVKKGPPPPRAKNEQSTANKTAEAAGGENNPDPTEKIAAAIIQTLEASENNADGSQAPETTMPERPRHQHVKKEPVFNIEFEGVIPGEGVLEMMPDGYGFLRSSD